MGTAIRKSYVLYNRTTDEICLSIPSASGSGTSITIPPSGGYDIFPIAGSIAACKNIPSLQNLVAMNIIHIKSVE